MIAGDVTIPEGLVDPRDDVICNARDFVGVASAVV